MLDFGFYNMDCVEGMKQFPDKYFDLAIVDPPYGSGSDENGGGYWNRFGERFDRYIDPEKNRGGRSYHGQAERGLRSMNARLSSGTLLHARNILTNCLGYQRIK